MDGEQTEKQWLSLVVVVVVDDDDAWSLCVWFPDSPCHCEKDSKLLKKRKIFGPFQNWCHARPSRGIVSLNWDMGQYSWDWMTCSNLDSFPSELYWLSVCPSCAEALCNREEKATLAGYCFFKYKFWTNIIALSHLWGTARFSASPCWCTIGLQKLQFIFALCISLGDIKWHRSHSHLISFSGSCLCSDESFHLLFNAGWWKDRAAGDSRPNVLCTHFYRP